MITVTSAFRNKRVFAELEGVEFRTKDAIRHTWFGMGDDLKDRANKEILRKPKSGHTYILRDKLGRRRRHVAGAPGETHANLTGKLRKSIGWKVHGYESMDFGYGITRPAPLYAPFLEFGTRRMKARPSLSLAIDATQANVQQHWEDGMSREFGR